MHRREIQNHVWTTRCITQPEVRIFCILLPPKTSTTYQLQTRKTNSKVLIFQNLQHSYTKIFQNLQHIHTKFFKIYNTVTPKFFKNSTYLHKQLTKLIYLFISMYQKSMQAFKLIWYQLSNFHVGTVRYSHYLIL